MKKKKPLPVIFLDILKIIRWICLLTAVAGGSSVATVGAVTVEGAPRLRTLSSMFAVTRGTPGRQKHRHRRGETELLFFFLKKFPNL